MGRGFLNARIAGRELGATEDIAPANHDCDLHAASRGLNGLPGDVNHFVHADAALAGMAKAFARKGGGGGGGLASTTRAYWL